MKLAIYLLPCLLILLNQPKPIQSKSTRLLTAFNQTESDSYAFKSGNSDKLPNAMLNESQMLNMRSLVNEKTGTTILLVENFTLKDGDQVFMDKARCDVIRVFYKNFECVVKRVLQQFVGNLEIVSNGSEVFSSKVEVDAFVPWEAESTWGEYGVPAHGDSVVVPEDKKIMISSAVPFLKKLEIRGTLSSRDVPGVVLPVGTLSIWRGQFLIGSKNVDFENNLNIIIGEENDVKKEEIVICLECDIMIFGKSQENESTIKKLKSTALSDTPEQLNNENKKNHFISKMSKNKKIHFLRKNNNLKDSNRPIIAVLGDASKSNLELPGIDTEVIYEADLKKRFTNQQTFLEIREKLNHLLPDGRRLSATKYWNNPSDWGSLNKVPDGSEDVVTIEKDTLMMLNVNTAIIKHLKIYGTLKFDESVDNLVLNAKIIEIIEGGELRFGDGTTSSDYNTNKAKILLHGKKEDPKVNIGNGRLTINKGIINKGTFLIHACKKKYNYANLGDSVPPLSSNIQKNIASYFGNKGDELVLYASSTKAEEREKVSIKSISGTSIFLNEKTSFYHHKNEGIQIQGKSLNKIQRVYNLTRNMKIEGSEDWGCVILNLAKINSSFYLDGVEIKYCGRLSEDLAAVNHLNEEGFKNSFEIRNSSFIDLDGHAIYINSKNSASFIRYNNFFSVIEKGINVKKSSYIWIEYNEIIGVRSSENNSNLAKPQINFGIFVDEKNFNSYNLISYNVISSIEEIGVGFFIPAETCNSPNVYYYFEENYAHSCDIGLLAGEKQYENCVTFPYEFTAFKNRVAGFAYFGNNPQVVINEFNLFENRRAIISVIGSNEGIEPIFKIMDSSIARRLSPSVQELYSGSKECKSDG